MRSLEQGYLFDVPISHLLLKAIHTVGEFRGRQRLYTEQFPEVLETLRRVAVIQSTESFNRIEGITEACNEFEGRVGMISTARGAKLEMVQGAIRHLPARLRFTDLQKACPGVSYPTLKRALSDLQRKGKLRCLGKGRDAQWVRTESGSH
jgi:hypothetical protein